MKIYKDGKVVKDGQGLYEGGLFYDRNTNKRRKNLPVFNVPFFGPSVSAKGVADKLEKPRPPYMLEKLTEELRNEKWLNFKKQKEPTWNINNPLKGPAKVAKNVGMFGGAMGIALINSLINDVLAPNVLPRKMDKKTGEYIDNPRDFDIRRIFFPNKFKK